ncbi:MAG: competence protein CoiA family protein [Candidatus Xenobiia bacterium LiM19]
MEEFESQQYELKVPFGIDTTGIEIYPENADKKTKYLCPDCGGELLLRKGAKKRPHFAHKAIPTNCDFLHNETESHLKAKIKVAKVINESLNIELLRKCRLCGHNYPQSLPVKDYHSSLEYILPSGHRADVAILNNNGKLTAVIEIFETHEVDIEKRKALEGLYWAEFYAIHILESDKWEMKVDNFKQFKCPRCKNIEKFKKDYPFVGNFYDEINCPKRTEKVNVIDICSSCEYFVDANQNGISCYGSKINATSR